VAHPGSPQRFWTLQNAQLCRYNLNLGA